MSDEEQSFDDGLAAEEDLSVSNKVGFLPAALMKILKWAALAVEIGRASCRERV